MAPTHYFFDNFVIPSGGLLKLKPVANSDWEKNINNAARTYTPTYEVSEDEDNTRISMDVPGVKAKDMKVELEETGQGITLHLSGKRRTKGLDNTSPSSVEEKKFSTMFTVDSRVKSDGATANLSDGVIVVKLPKHENISLTHTVSVTENEHATLSVPGVSEDDENITITMDVPGLKAKDLNIEVEHSSKGPLLRLSGWRRGQCGASTKRRKFSRIFAVGHMVEAGNIKANVAEGVIVINVPKRKDYRKLVHVSITENSHPELESASIETPSENKETNK